MALVLRKAVLQQKNMSLLKFYKGRSVTYNNLGVSYRKNRTYLSTAVRRRMKLEKPRQNPTIEKIQKTLPSTAVEVNDQVFSSPSLRCCYSCPNVTKIRDQTDHSPFRTRTVFEIPSTQTISNKSSKTPAMSRLLQANLSQMSFMRNYSDCNLPPPSNQAPRCVQTMTGYYYYPYGWWFCGPYHVTGLCCPVGPGGPCPPKCAPPCPPKCCPCGPCTPMPPRIGGCSCCNCVCPASAAAPANAPVPQGQSPLKQLKDASQNPEMNPQSMRSRISKFFPVNTAVPAGASEMPYKRNSPNTAIVPRNPNKVAKGYSGTLDHPRKMSHYAAPYTRQTNHLLEVKEMTNDKSPFNQKAGNNVPSRGYHHVAESRYKVQRSPIYHKRYRSLTFDTCPTIGLPKAMLSLEQTDKIPEVVFEYSSIPNCPNPLGNFDLNFKPYESNF